MFLESSEGQAGDARYLTSPSFQTGAAAAVSFAYHMYGVDTGSLSLEALSQDMWSKRWGRAGQQQATQEDAWRHSGEVLLPASSTQVRFKSVRSSLGC